MGSREREEGYIGWFSERGKEEAWKEIRTYVFSVFQFLD